MRNFYVKKISQLTLCEPLPQCNLHASLSNVSENLLRFRSGPGLEKVLAVGEACRIVEWDALHVGRVVLLEFDLKFVVFA